MTAGLKNMYEVKSENSSTVVVCLIFIKTKTKRELINISASFTLNLW